MSKKTETGFNQMPSKC